MTGLEQEIGAAAAAYARLVVRRLRDALGGGLEGVYLIGSAALGDYVPGRSDLDIAAVCARSPSVDEKKRVVATLSHEALPCPARKLELVLYPRDLGGPGPGFPVLEINLNTGAGTGTEFSFDTAGEPRHWFVLDLSIGRRGGKPLFGPPAGGMLPDPPRPLVIAALEESIAWHASHDATGEATVLSACRAWMYAVEKTWGSKTQAANWARQQLDDTGTIDAALAIRNGQRKSRLAASDIEPVTSGARAALRQ